MNIKLSKMNEEYVKVVCEALDVYADDVVNTVMANAKDILREAVKKQRSTTRSKAFDHTGPNLAEDIVTSGQPTYEQALFAYMAEWCDGLVLLNKAYGKDMGDLNE